MRKNNNYGYLIFLFIFLSIIGGILEIFYMLIIEQRFVVGGFFHAPVRPIYGFGGLLLYLLPKSLKRNDLTLFMSSFVVCSIFEYISSYLIEVLFDMKIWDYSNFLFNINGRICLVHSCIWGILGIIFNRRVELVINKMYNQFSTILFRKSFIRR